MIIKKQIYTSIGESCAQAMLYCGVPVKFIFHDNKALGGEFLSCQLQGTLRDSNGL